MRKIKTCLGCGVRLQDENILNIGYTANINNDLCMRCFRLKNYGEYESVANSLVNYESILSFVNRTHDLALYVVDILNINEDLLNIRKYVKNDIILVLNKRDLLPKSVKDEKILTYIKSLNLNFIDTVIVSSEKNYNIDLLYKKIKKYRKSSNVYVLGWTNAGKSSLITKLLSSFGSGESSLTVSPLPSTTLSKIDIKINDGLTIVDTPGIIDNSNIINFVDKKMYKKLNPKREIKPKTYQLSPNQSLIIGGMVRLDYVEGERNSFTFFIPNDIKVKRVNYRKDDLRALCLKDYDIKYDEDLVINGLGFIKIVSKCHLHLYINKDIKTWTRKKLI